MTDVTNILGQIEVGDPSATDRSGFTPAGINVLFTAHRPIHAALNPLRIVGIDTKAQ